MGGEATLAAGVGDAGPVHGGDADVADTDVATMDGGVAMRDRRHRDRGENPNLDSPAISELRDEIQVLAASIHAAEAELIRKLVLLDDVDGWCGSGVRSMTHWLTLRCGFTRSEAARRAELVRRREELPELFGVFDEGRISAGFAHSAQKVATGATDAEIARVSILCTHPQASRTFASFRETARAIDEEDRSRARSSGGAGEPGADGTEPAGPAADDPEGYDPIDRGVWLHTWWDEQEHLRVDARLDATDGATLRTLLEQLRTHGVPNCSAGGSVTDSDGPVDASRAGVAGSELAGAANRWLSQPEAFAAVLRLAGDALADARVRGRWLDRFAITVTIDAEALAGAKPGCGVLADGTTVSVPQVCGWIEQASLEPLITQGGRPLYMGRSVRIATPAQRRALRVRDGGCAFPGCGCTEGLEAHHIVEWEDGGETNINNMVLLCRRHHRLLHRGEFTITMEAGLPRFHSRVLDTAGGRPRGSPLSELPGFRSPSGDATNRSCEPLTHYARDVLVGSLLSARKANRAEAQACRASA